MKEIINHKNLDPKQLDMDFRTSKDLAESIRLKQQNNRKLTEEELKYLREQREQDRQDDNPHFDH